MVGVCGCKRDHCSDGTVLYPDCSGDCGFYKNLHV